MKALKAGFHGTAHRVLPAPVGSRTQVITYKHFNADCPMEPLALTTCRYLALSALMAFVEITGRISTSLSRYWMKSSRAFVHRLQVPGTSFPYVQRAPQTQHGQLERSRLRRSPPRTV